MDSPSVGGVGESHAVAGGDEDVGVVHEPADDGGGDGAGHELVEVAHRLTRPRICRSRRNPSPDPRTHGPTDTLRPR